MSAHKELETKFAPVIYTAQNEGWHPKKLAAALVDLLPAEESECAFCPICRGECDWKHGA